MATTVPKHKSVRKTGNIHPQGSGSVVKNIKKSHNMGGPSPGALVAEAIHTLSKKVDALEKLTDAPCVIDLKDVKVDPAMEQIKSILLRKGLKHVPFRYSRQAPLRVLIAAKKTVSVANAALTTVSSLDPVNSSDAKSLAVVYDVCRTTAVDVKLIWTISNTASSVPTGPAVHGEIAAAYDAASNGVYASVVQVTEAQFHLGPIPITGYGGTAGNQIIGVPHMRVKIPRLVDPGILTDLLDSNWVSSADTSVIVGYLKPYGEPVGAALTLTMEFYLLYEMEFAYRT